MSKAYDVLVGILTEKFRIPESELSPDVTLEDVDLDSLGRVEFMITLRDQTGAPFSEEQFTLDTTLLDIATALETSWETAATP
ncbi:phosphopantetheine-binding protein [Streptomyces sp. YS-3]|uniref:phosphopantetheine-binding protein n=1 Tax=Streptomyces sp. YS-3 TaxID=3381352 RepID=UPI0038625005